MKTRGMEVGYIRYGENIEDSEDGGGLHEMWGEC